MPAVIDNFDGEFAFLSNFYPSPVAYEGAQYPTIEHAFQAAKTLDQTERERVRLAATPGNAKRIGRRVHLREDWEEIKVDVMRSLLAAKFSDERLKQNLLATRDATLVEGNTWHDNYWGDCRCDRCGKRNGANMLGNLLMQVREIMRMNELSE
jgi:ribA/ribD-fused uncharacterized protein